MPFLRDFNLRSCDRVELVSVRKGSFSALGGRAAAILATQTFGGGTGGISTARPPSREAVLLPAKAGERNEQIIPSFRTETSRSIENSLRSFRIESSYLSVHFKRLSQLNIQ